MSLFFITNPALAHRLNIFAWLEGDQVMVECNFGRRHPAIQAEVRVFDSDTKQELVRGRTDNAGHFAFAVPQAARQGHGLTIDVNAGQGHRNEWTMDASGIYASAPLTADSDQTGIAGQKLAARENNQKQPDQAGHSAPEHKPASGVAHPSPQSVADLSMSRPQAQITPERLKSIIYEAMESQLAPIRHELAASSARTPGFTEIIGGLGWIAGIMGIWLYLKSRRGQ